MAAPLSRTRSLRATAPSLRPGTRTNPSPLSTNTTMTSTTASSSSTAPSRTTAAQSQPTGPSSLTLFLSNLRLLDLDLLPDWPDITTKTFQNTQGQGQKKRVHCVEWALFRLFEIFDPEEAKQKLKPLFPPQDQVSSMNLRAALLKALENAKKNGTLDKNTILRRTMLDECKGERLEDVLAAFSTAVLRLVVSEEVAASGAYVTPALALALEPKSYNDDRTDLTVLNMVLRKEVNGMLVKRKNTERKYRDFESLLGVRERGVQRKREMLKEKEGQTRRKVVGEDARWEMERVVRNNWTGNERWMETMLYGETGSGAKEGGLFGMEFERVWRRVEQKRLSELEEGGVGLLTMLEKRVQGHESRLDAWEKWRRELGGGKARAKERKGVESGQPTQKKKQGIDLGFEGHQDLQIGMVKPAKKNPLGQQKGQQIKSDLIQNLEKELTEEDNSSKKASSTLNYLFGPRQHKIGSSLETTTMEDDQHISDISDLEDHPHIEEPKPSPPKKPAFSRRLPARPKLDHPMTKKRDYTDPDLEGFEEEVPEAQFESPKQIVSPQAMSRRGSKGGGLSRSRSPEKVIMQPFTAIYQSHPPEVLEDGGEEEEEGGEGEEGGQGGKEREVSPISPTQDAADEILLHMQNASPSPSKPSKPRHKLSLAERTRLSMARGSFDEVDDFEPLVTSSPTATTMITSTIPIASPEEETQEAEVNAKEDLASRTRKSMQNFEKARLKGQVERRRSLRRSKVAPARRDGRDSYFEKVSEEEEGDEGEEYGGIGGPQGRIGRKERMSLRVDELLGEEDAERVFMSRPRVKASPVGSPRRGWEEEENEE